MRQLGAVLGLLFFSASFVEAASGSAEVIGAGKGEIGVFRPLRLGLAQSTEVQVQPLAFFLLPHAAIKQVWLEHEGWVLASQHRLSYPTLALKTLRRRGIGGLVELEAEIPEILATGHELLLTNRRDPNLSYTLKAGAGVAAKNDSGNWRSIELPIVFARTASYHKGLTGYVGFDVDYRINEKWDMYLEADVFRTAYTKARWHLEESIMFRWRASDNSRIEFGTKFMWGDYLYGKQKHVLPLIDWVYAFGHGILQ